MEGTYGSPLTKPSDPGASEREVRPLYGWREMARNCPLRTGTARVTQTDSMSQREVGNEILG
jgi:hypothetical protein